MTVYLHFFIVDTCLFSPKDTAGLEPTFEIHHGDTRKVIEHIRPVHCVMCSPPYFQQRKYGDRLGEEVGQEASVQQYIDELVAIFTAIPLHPAGSIWVNLGDKRGMNGGLLNIPARFSIAMLDAGFILVDHVVWAKAGVNLVGDIVGNCMPEPCRDRLNGNGHEPLFHFVRPGADAWTDACAVQIPRYNVPTVRYLPADLMTAATAINGRYLLNVWNLPMGQTSEKHYAVYPPALCERPIAFTCPPFVNPDGSLPRRIVTQIPYDEGKGKIRVFGKHDTESSQQTKGRQDTGRSYTPKMPVSLGWEPLQHPWTPGIVLDPFCGTGTTGRVALSLGRSFIGIDLYKNYCEIAMNQCKAAFQTVQKTYSYDKLYEMIRLDQEHLLTAKPETVDMFGLISR